MLINESMTWLLEGAYRMKLKSRIAVLRELDREFMKAKSINKKGSFTEDDEQTIIKSLLKRKEDSYLQNPDQDKLNTIFHLQMFIC